MKNKSSYIFGSYRDLSIETFFYFCFTFNKIKNSFDC